MGGQMRMIKEWLAVTVPTLHHRTRAVINHPTPALGRIVSEDSMNKWKPRCILQESGMAKSRLAGATDIIPSGTTTNDLVESKLRAQVHCT